MNQKHELEELFSVLEDTDEETLLHIAEHYPLADKKQIEEVFAMSEKKYQAGTDFINPAEEETYEVQIVKHTGWYKTVIGAVACLAVTVGAVGAVAKIKPVQPEPDFSVAEVAESITETQPETTRETKISETSRKHSETTINAVQNTETPAETVMTAVSETIPAVITTAVQSQTVAETTRITTTQTVLEVIQEEEVSVPEPETQYIPEIIENQPLPEVSQETEISEEIQPEPENPEFVLEEAQINENGLPIIPGFTLKYLDPYRIAGGAPYDITPVDIYSMHKRVQNKFTLDYIPDTMQYDDEYTTELYDGIGSYKKDFHTADSINFVIVQCLGTSDVNFVGLSTSATEDDYAYENLTFYPFTVSGNYGYIKVN